MRLLRFDPACVLIHRSTRYKNGSHQSDLPQCTVDLLMLIVIALGPVHGYAIPQRLEQVSHGVVQVPEGPLYPALHRLENRGLLAANLTLWLINSDAVWNADFAWPLADFAGIRPAQRLAGQVGFAENARADAKFVDRACGGGIGKRGGANGPHVMLVTRNAHFHTGSTLKRAPDEIPQPCTGPR
jgi:hypothetical protein